ncbi:hypothetical protein F4808DRAFT_421088, partial [Astrocystis sublimbata]
MQGRTVVNKRNASIVGRKEQQWANVLERREYVLEAEAWRCAGGGEGNDNSNSASTSTSTSSSTSKPISPDRCAKALRFAARRITDELTLTHQILSRHLDATYPHLVTAALADEERQSMTHPEEVLKPEKWLEYGCLRGRRAEDDKMDYSLFVSARLLERRVRRLMVLKAEMARGVEMLQRAFPEPPIDPRVLLYNEVGPIRESAEEQRNEKARLEGAKALIRQYRAASLDVQKGVLYRLRREALPKGQRPILGVAFTWEEWRLANCGDTSCFSAPSKLAISKMLNPFQGESVAKVASAEAEWLQGLGDDGPPRISRAVYEEACCQPGMELSERLMCGSKQPLV